MIFTQKQHVPNNPERKQGLFIREVTGRDGSRTDIVLLNKRGSYDFDFHALGNKAPDHLTRHYTGMATLDAKLRVGNCDACGLEGLKHKYVCMMADSWQGANEAKKAGSEAFRNWIVARMESPEVQKLFEEYAGALGTGMMKRLSSFMIYDFCVLAGFEARLGLMDGIQVAVLSKSFFFDPEQESFRENVLEIAPKISFATRDLGAIRSIAFMLEGIDHLQAKDYHAAFECFDYSIGLWSLNHFAHAKRAVCECKLGFEMDGLSDLNISIAIQKDSENPLRDDSLHAIYRLDRATIFKNVAYKTGELQYARQALKDCRKSLSLQDSDAGNAMLTELGEVFGLG